jgi:hypothetical protein
MSMAVNVLAVAEVSGGKLVASSPAAPGVTYDPSNGVLTFPNPQGAKYIPFVSNVDNGKPYITSNHWIQEITGTYIVVKQCAMDTGGRVWFGSDFTALILSY